MSRRSSDSHLDRPERIPSYPLFSDADEFIEACDHVDEGAAPPLRIRKQLVAPGDPGQSNPIAPEGSEVYVHYEVFDDIGGLHDSSRQRDCPYHFTLGETHAASLWATAIRSMVTGERAIFHCQAKHIYKSYKMPTTIRDVHTNLNVHIEYLRWDDWSNVVYDGRIKKKILNRGSREIATPNDGSNVTVKYTGNLIDGTVFENFNERRLTICKDDIIEGLELAIKSMCRGEKSLFRVDPSYAWGKAGDSSLGVPPHSLVEYQVQLMEYSAGTLKWEMSAEEKLKFALCRKGCGNLAYKLGHLERSERLYNHALELVQYEGESNITEDIKRLKVDVLNNLSALKLKQCEYSEAIVFSSKALALDPSSFKALNRRAMCYMQSRQPDLALNDVIAALTIDSNSANLKEMQSRCKQAVAKAHRKTAARFGGWCDRISLDQETPKESDPDVSNSLNTSKADALQ